MNNKISGCAAPTVQDNSRIVELLLNELETALNRIDSASDSLHNKFQPVMYFTTPPSDPAAGMQCPGSSDLSLRIRAIESRVHAQAETLFRMADASEL